MKLSFVLALIVLLIGCSKKDKTELPVVVEPTALTIDSSQATPGDALRIELDKKITQTQVFIQIGTTQVKGYAANDSEYVFFMPEAAPGKVAITIPSIKNSNSLSLTVKQYTPIADASVVIAEFANKQNSCIDSIKKIATKINQPISAHTLVMIDQLKQEWNDQLAKLQAADKVQLAYVLKKIMPQPADFSLGFRKANNPVNKLTGVADAAERLMGEARKYVTLKIACLVQIPVIVTSLYSLILAPNPISALLLAGSIGAFIILREAVLQQVQVIGSLPGIVEYITEANVNRVLTNEFYNNTTKAIAMNVQLRNLKTTDRNIHSDISNAFDAESEMAVGDQKVEGMYTKAKEYTTKLKEPYEPYVSGMGRYPLITDVSAVDANEILVTGVSDSRIGYSAFVSGSSQMIKITSTAGQEIPFDINLAFKRTLDRAEFTKKIACLFKPEIASNISISNASKYPITEGQGYSCIGYVISDFTCSEANWNDAAQRPQIKDAFGNIQLINGVLLENITNSWGFQFSACTSADGAAVVFYNVSKNNGVVTGKVKAFGDVGNCDPPYGDVYFRSFRFSLICSTLPGYMKTDFAGTYVVASNSLGTSQ